MPFFFAGSPLPNGLEQVSSGLNLWLELDDPCKMGELLEKLLAETDAIAAALDGLHYVHFARFVPTPDRCALQVITSFDGEFDAYVLDFVLAIGDQFEMILSYVRDRPPSRVKDHPAAFLKFINDRNLGYDTLGGGGIGLHSAYPRRTVIDIVGASGMAPAAVEPQPVDVDRSDVQANILRGVSLRLAWHVALLVGPTDEARAFLNELLTGSQGAPRVTNDAPWAPQGRPPAYAMTLGFTHAGLLAMGISDGDRAAFALGHKAFVHGPDGTDAATGNGDVGDSRPDFWQLGGAYPVDMVVSIYADDGAELARRTQALLERASAHRLSVVNRPWPAQALFDERYPGHHLVHFGYVDGLSQPRLAIVGEPAGQPEPEFQPRANVGEFLLGAAYPNVFGGRDSLGGLSPELAQNATFAALRIMEQDVAGFAKLLQHAGTMYGVDPEWLAAKLMGRWRDGTPLAQFPDHPMPEADAPGRNRFDYLPSADHPFTADDSAGLRCPMGAHIRRMNPRSSTVAGRPHSRRLLRRGMPYGPAYDPDSADDGQPRGLVGLFLCADLDRQFEFILRQWAQGDRATTGLVGQQDPMLGAQTQLHEGRPMPGQYRIARSAEPDIAMAMPRLVKTIGSAYLFMPGLAGLKYLASGAGAPLLRGMSLLPGAIPDPATFDPRAKEFRDNPFPIYAWFRDNHPAVHLPTMGSTWVFSHRHLAEVANDMGRFRKRKSTDSSPAGILNMDPPPHTGCRAEVQLLFQQVLGDIAPGIAGLVSRSYLDGCQNKGQANPIDWIAAFAQPVAQGAFFDLFGLTVSQASGLIGEVQAILRLATPADDEQAHADIAKKLEKVAVSLFLDLKRYRKPNRMFDRILGMTTLHDPNSNKPRLGASALQVEQIANAATLALAGFLPLQWFIALATWRLLENDGALLQMLRADRSITNTQVVDELLRFDSSLPLSDRYAVTATTIGGVQLAMDDRVTMAWSSANHDPAEFGADADQINFKRGKGSGWAFGAAGERNCLGRAMVYSVMEPVIQTLRDAVPVPRLATGFNPAWGTRTEGAMFRTMAALLVHC